MTCHWCGKGPLSILVVEVEFQVVQLADVYTVDVLFFHINHILNDTNIHMHSDSI